MDLSPSGRRTRPAKKHPLMCDDRRIFHKTAVRMRFQGRQHFHLQAHPSQRIHVGSMLICGAFRIQRQRITGQGANEGGRDGAGQGPGWKHESRYRAGRQPVNTLGFRLGVAMQVKGHFTLMTVDEFGSWLDALHLVRQITRIQNHHTWSPSYKNFDGSNHFTLMEGMEAAHLERGFSGIAQHITTFPDGKLCLGRSFELIPAGIKGANTGAVCIENVGCFDAGGDTMRTEQRDTIVRVNAKLARKFSLAPNTDAILYHHWFDLVTGARTDGAGSTKTCPGTAFFGGNTVDAAKRNFLPLVEASMKGLTVPPVAPLRVMTVSADRLNVREKPGVEGAVLGQVTKGTVVAVYEDRGDWSRVHPTRAMWCSRFYLV